MLRNFPSYIWKIGAKQGDCFFLWRWHYVAHDGTGGSGRETLFRPTPFSAFASAYELLP